MKSWQYEGYLTEDKLYKFLSNFFGITRQYKIGKKSVDFYFEHNEVKYIVEFNGYHHYSSIKHQTRDELIQTYCNENNIHLVMIPYFIQLEDRVFDILFGCELADYISSKIGFDWVASVDHYKHGFIDNKAMLPWDFNIYGYKRFTDEYKLFTKHDRMAVMREIFDSLVIRSKDMNIKMECSSDLLPDKLMSHYPT